MSRKLTITMSCCVIFATILIGILYVARKKPLYERNSFTRKYAESAATKAGKLDIAFNSYYIAGITEEHIYLGNVTAPLHLLIINHALTDSQFVRLTIEAVDNQQVSSATKIKVGSPNFYLTDGITPILYRGKIGEWKAKKFLPYQPYFTQIVPISATSFALRTNRKSTLDHTLGRLQQTRPYLRLEPNLLQRQVDGIFCTDGMLSYNKELQRLVYTHFYRNEFIVCDTNLNLDYRGHTIDTFSQAQIKVAHISSNNTNRLIDRKVINMGSCTSGNYLFINSNLLARNDTPEDFPAKSIIDVYDLTNSTYRFSFTIPNQDSRTKIRELKVFKNEFILILYNHYVERYNLRPTYFRYRQSG